MAIDSQEYINKMYDSSLESQKQTLTQDYETNTSNLEAEQQKAQKRTDANLNRTYVEAAKAQKGYNEVQNAYGLSSGAMAQARLAQDNQLQSDLTALRATQQETDAEVERQRSLLAKEYASAIAKAQADNDMERAQALYEAAKDDEAALLKQQKEAASLMASVGDYSLYQNLYGLTDAQLRKLQGDTGSGNSGSGTGRGSGIGEESDDEQQDRKPTLTEEELAKIEEERKKALAAQAAVLSAQNALYGITGDPGSSKTSSTINKALNYLL